ncbi:ATP-dependent DNA helicase RecG [Thiohalomonas denitrificans]|uniref:ATP-dependent DNA helicase RecG n=1 Tax=Thiohalomonas denitrificans TaxID=415747 RepID=A0A1G5QTR7_9GAMM|nr:ATP-dependent DNA helicase RecG [Thiohalomonas denitrificans]
MVKATQRRAPADPTDLPVNALRGVGPRIAERLERLGITRVYDLLFHLPTRYQDRTRVVPIGTLRPGDEAVVEGRVQLTEVKFARRRMLLSRITDNTGSMTLRLFHFNAAQREMLERGARVRCYGQVRSGAATLEMVHPEFRRLEGEEPAPVDEHLTPIYPTTEGLHQLSLRQLTDQALGRMAAGGPPDLLPRAIREEFELPPLDEALRYLHHPPPEAALDVLSERRHPAQQRLAFEELLAHRLSLRRLRARVTDSSAPPLLGNGHLREQFERDLPFALTGAQRRVSNEIAVDLDQPHPMQRLVQGDVGSGKTVVAALAVLKAIEAGFQAAVMAPTEILAEQHFRSFRNWLEPLGLEVVWLSGKQKVGTRRGAMEHLASGAAAVAVGTHALFQEAVDFDELGLVVIDEQHRFGVHQRLALREKGKVGERYPHQLIMTATPIPRTLAMTAYADLDVSVIDELPPGRTPVETVVVADSRRDEVVERVHAACRSGAQAYWVCTLVEESDALQCQAAEESAEELSEALPDLRVGLVHGRMKPKDKESVMADFKAGVIDLLVATTVIEVGVDVPNASLMIIENAERFGLAQLHQLRGRVGRGRKKSSCVLMYHGPLSQTARQRLAAMRETADGFEIARRDLELRGPGEVLGTRQTGMLNLRIADLQRDQPLLPAVARAADRLLEQDAKAVDAIIQRWLGQGERYGEV